MILTAWTDDKVRDEPLPEECTELVERVVRATRLWPAEKRDVRAEMVSHFREGLIELRRQNVPPEECVEILCDAFGNIDLAASLIRRAKKRSRPMIWKIAAGAAVAGLVCVGGVAGFVAWSISGKPNPQVDYVAVINEPVEAVPQEDRAWPLWKDILFDFKLMDSGLKRVAGSRGEIKVHPGDENWPQVAGWVRSNEGLLDDIHEAASRDVYGFVYGQKDTRRFINELARWRDPNTTHLVTEDWDESEPYPRVLAILLPQLSDMREIARFLVAYSRGQMAAGDFALAWSALDDAQRMGVQLMDSMTLIEQLVGSSIIRFTTAEMADVLYTYGGQLQQSDVDLIESSHLFSTPADVFAGNYEGERITFEDVVQYVFTDDGEGNGLLIPEQFARVSGSSETSEDKGWASGFSWVAMAAMHADRADTLAKYDEVWNRIHEVRQLPLYSPRRRQMDDVIEQMMNDTIDRHRYALIWTMTPSLSTADRALRETAMVEDATETLAALASYRFDMGEYPKHLGDLVPTYLAAVPVDIYTGQALLYRLGDDGGDVYLYSVGRDLEDGGGSRKMVKDPMRDHGTATEDIVFWPPAK